MKKTLENIWCVLCFALPLQTLSKTSGMLKSRSKAERAMKKEFFEKIKIQTEVVVQEAVF